MKSAVPPLLLLAGAFVLGLASCPDRGEAPAPDPGSPRFVRDAAFPLPGVPEPSGIDWDSARGRLWVVDDGGVLARVDPADGTVEATRDVGGDLEAVRWLPGADLLIAVREEDATLVLVHASSMEIAAIASIEVPAGISPAPGARGNGFEGLAVLGTGSTLRLLLANQDDPHALYEATLPVPSPLPSGGSPASLQATLTNVEPLAPINLSEVVLDREGRVWVLYGYSLSPRLVALDEAWEETRTSIPLQELAAEGAVFAPDGTLWIADDTGGLVRYVPEP